VATGDAADEEVQQESFFGIGAPAEQGQFVFSIEKIDDRGNLQLRLDSAGPSPSTSKKIRISTTAMQ
jgi:hypothetical protein